MRDDRSLLETWHESFLRVIQERATAERMKAASLAKDLRTWTECLTAAVVASCSPMGWVAAAKGHPFGYLPKSGQEYLGIDVMAFQDREATQRRWPLPVAAFELENSPQDDRVAYSLWKVLCVRAPLRVVFAYRQDWDQARQLVNNLGQDVIADMPPHDRSTLEGQTAVITGSRGEGETFPWGYFKLWRLDANLGRFEKV